MRLVIGLTILLTLVACAPPKKTAYIEYKKDHIQIPEHTPIIVDVTGQEKVPFFGQMIDSSKNSPAVQLLYPAANGGMLLASIITHAVMEQSIDNAQKTELAEKSNLVLTPYLAVTENLPTEALLNASQEMIQLGEQFDLIATKSGASYAPQKNTKQQANIWRIRCKPVFFMAQDEHVVILKNVVEIYSSEQIEKPIYQNMAEVISTDDLGSVNAQSYWLEGYPPRLQVVSAELFAESIEIAMADLLAKFSMQGEKEQTFKFEQGGDTTYERGVLVAKSDERTTIRTLRGWLKSIPNNNFVN